MLPKLKIHSEDLGQGEKITISDDQPPSTSKQVNQFLRSVQSGAFRAALLATHHETEALDLVQDAMLRWIASEYNKKPTQEWKPLFFIVLRNRIRDWQRRSILTLRLFHSNTHQVDEDGWMLSLTDSTATGERLPEQILTDQEFSRALISALDKLPARQRETFILRTWQGLSTRETAMVMGCSEGSVMTQLSRAHSCLQQKLKQFNQDNIHT